MNGQGVCVCVKCDKCTYKIVITKSHIRCLCRFICVLSLVLLPLFCQAHEQILTLVMCNNLSRKVLIYSVWTQANNLLKGGFLATQGKIELLTRSHKRKKFVKENLLV